MGRFQDSEVEEAKQPLTGPGDVLEKRSTLSPIEEESVGDRSIIYVKERRTAWSFFASFFAAFTLGAIAASILVGLMWHQSDLDIQRKLHKQELEKPWAFAKTDAKPIVPDETVIFESNPLYSMKASDDTDFAWNKLLPNGRGYVFVPDAEERGLPPGEQTPFGPIYSVAMFHQLHCLARIRSTYWIFLDAVTTGEDAIARAHADRGGMSHVQHCMDYLRQSIMCNGDMTLEWPKQEGPSKGVAVDGWGVPHTCKSPAAIQDYMDLFHSNMSINFDAAG